MEVNPPNLNAGAADDMLNCGWCGKTENKKHWRRHWKTQHDNKPPFELKPGDDPVEPNFEPKKGGNRAIGEDRRS